MVKKESQASHIARMILDSVDHSQSVQMGMLGQIMVEHAKVKESEEHPPISDDKEEELVRKMRALKNAEIDGDLFWIDYKSWNVLGFDFRKLFDEILTPLYWNGAFCRYTEFKAFESNLFAKLPDGVVANLICREKVYQLFCVASNAREYHMMNIRDFEQLQQVIRANLLRSYCRIDDSIVVKEFTYARKPIKITTKRANDTASTSV